MNRPRSIFVSILFLSVFTACSTTKKEADLRSRITECNAGSNISLSASLGATLEKNVNEGISITAGVEEKIKGLFLNNAKVSEENAVKLYELYNHCLERVSKGA